MNDGEKKRKRVKKREKASETDRQLETEGREKRMSKKD